MTNHRALATEKHEAGEQRPPATEKHVAKHRNTPVRKPPLHGRSRSSNPNVALVVAPSQVPSAAAGRGARAAAALPGCSSLATSGA